MRRFREWRRRLYKWFVSPPKWGSSIGPESVFILGMLNSSIWAAHDQWAFSLIWFAVGLFGFLGSCEAHR